MVTAAAAVTSQASAAAVTGAVMAFWAAVVVGLTAVPAGKPLLPLGPASVEGNKQ